MSMIVCMKLGWVCVVVVSMLFDRGTCVGGFSCIRCGVVGDGRGSW